MFRHLSALIRKEFLLDWRNRYAVIGLALYIGSTVFLCYLCFTRAIDIQTWNALFWVIILFAGVNAIAKSFLQESHNVQLFYYITLNPQTVIISKIIYNTLLLLILSLIHFIIFSSLLGNPVENNGMYLTALVFGSFGISSVLTMISAIASRAGTNTTLISILGFPILFPLLITIVKFSRNAIDGIAWSLNWQFVVLLLAINALVIALSYLLFPYLWRE